MSSPDRIKKLMTVCSKHGINEDTRHNMIYDWTSGRTDSSRLMHNEEIDDLVWKLNNEVGFSEKEKTTTDYQRGDKQRKYMLSMCYQVGWTKYDERKQRDVVDMNRLNNWCVTYGALHKPLAQYKYLELSALVRQFENVVQTLLQQKSPK